MPIQSRSCDVRVCVFLSVCICATIDSPYAILSNNIGSLIETYDFCDIFLHVCGPLVRMCNHGFRV